MKSPLPVDVGDIDLRPAISKDLIDGAEGGEVDAGTEARYSAPALCGAGMGTSTLAVLFLL